jgi:hypothetical protein
MSIYSIKQTKQSLAMKSSLMACDKLIYTSIQIYKTATLQRRLSSID